MTKEEQIQWAKEQIPEITEWDYWFSVVGLQNGRLKLTINMDAPEEEICTIHVWNSNHLEGMSIQECRRRLKLEAFQ